jgi:hypothetical protein
MRKERHGGVCYCGTGTAASAMQNLLSPIGHRISVQIVLGRLSVSALSCAAETSWRSLLLANRRPRGAGSPPVQTI